MDKNDFLSKLRHGLRGFDRADVEDIISYYNELICDKMENGMTEEEAIASFGDVKNVISKLSGQIIVRSNRKMSPAKTSGIVIGALCSPVLIPVAIVAIVLYLTFYACAISFIVSFAAAALTSFGYGIIMCVGVFAADGIWVALTYLGIGITLGALFSILTVLIVKFSIYTLKLMNKLFVKIINKKHKEKRVSEKEVVKDEIC